MTTITTPAITLEDVLRALMETQAMMEKTLNLLSFKKFVHCTKLPSVHQEPLPQSLRL